MFRSSGLAVYGLAFFDFGVWGLGFQRLGYRGCRVTSAQSSVPSAS